MKYTEEAVTFACAGETLVGILATPATASRLHSTGVVVIVGGPQYRGGSHRQFILLSRALAAAGYPVLRFDYRGMGDSSGQQRDFLQVAQDVGGAIDLLQQRLPSVTRVVLWGLCDGASAALLYCGDTGDPRVRGLCLLNPWVRSQESLARTHVKHYYADRLRQKDFWLKLLSGKVAASAATGLWRNLVLAVQGSRGKPSGDTRTFQERMATAWQEFGGAILLILSGNDYTAKEFVGHSQTDGLWNGLLERASVTRLDLPDADHTFSEARLRAQVESTTLAWLESQPRT